jgi:hypothetical protein
MPGDSLTDNIFPRVDKVRVSGEAKSPFEADQSKRLEEIRTHLEDGYYISPFC